MNKERFEALPEDIQRIIDENSGLKMSVEAGKAYDTTDVPGKRVFEENGGTVHPLSAQERQRWIDAALPVRTAWIEEMRSKGLPGDEVLAHAVELLKQY